MIRYRYYLNAYVKKSIYLNFYFFKYWTGFFFPPYLTYLFYHQYVFRRRLFRMYTIRNLVNGLHNMSSFKAHMRTSRLNLVKSVSFIYLRYKKVRLFFYKSTLHLFTNFFWFIYTIYFLRLNYINVKLFGFDIYFFTNLHRLASVSSKRTVMKTQFLNLEFVFERSWFFIILFNKLKPISYYFWNLFWYYPIQSSVKHLYAYPTLNYAWRLPSNILIFYRILFFLILQIILTFYWLSSLFFINYTYSSLLVNLNYSTS